MLSTEGPRTDEQSARHQAARRQL